MVNGQCTWKPLPWVILKSGGTRVARRGVSSNAEGWVHQLESCGALWLQALVLGWEQVPAWGIKCCRCSILVRCPHTHTHTAPACRQEINSRAYKLLCRRNQSM